MSGSVVAVRPIAESDRERWNLLFRAYGEFYESDFSDEILDRVWALLQEDRTLHALVAELDGEVIGLAHYRWHPDTFSGDLDWFLDDLFTDPAHRGTGAATALIEALAAKGRATAPNGTLRWITAADNSRAQSVYDKVATRATWVTYEVKL